MKPEQRIIQEWIRVFELEQCITPYMEEKLVNALTAHTEPEDELKCDRIGGCLKINLDNPHAKCKCDPKGTAHTEPEDERKYATMEEVFPEFTTTEPEDEKPKIACPEWKSLVAPLTHTEPEDCEHGYRINPVEGVHIPCPDCHTEPADEVSKYQIASEVYDEYFASQPYPLAIEYLGDVLSFSQFLDRMKRLQQEKNDNT